MPNKFPHVEVDEIVAPTEPSLFTFRNPRRDDPNDIYARRMYPIFEKVGHALRRAEPQPINGDRLDEPLIGDVCYLDAGVPYRLYNIIWPDWDAYEKPDHIPTFRSVCEGFYTHTLARLPEPAVWPCPGVHWASEKTSRKDEVELHGYVHIVDTNEHAH
jgi:hypothetical protein